jgi:hypothetical protein
MKNIWARTSALLVTPLVCNTVIAADDGGNWDFQLTPLYYWSINIGGSADTSDPGEPPDPPIDMDGFDLEFKGAFSLNFDTVYRQRWGLIFDTVAVRLNNQENDDDSLFLDFRYKQAELDGYRRWTSGQHAFDLLAGVRYYKMEIGLEGTSRSGEADIADPIVGGRWGWQFAEKWKLGLRGDIGGFGVGSEFVWQALAVVQWMPWQNVGFLAGGRYMDIDLEDDSEDLAVNMDIWGPILAITFRW